MGLHEDGIHAACDSARMHAFALGNHLSNRTSFDVALWEHQENGLSWGRPRGMQVES